MPPIIVKEKNRLVSKKVCEQWTFNWDEGLLGEIHESARLGLSGWCKLSSQGRETVCQVGFGCWVRKCHAKDDVRFSGVYISIDIKSRKALDIRRIHQPVDLEGV